MKGKWWAARFRVRGLSAEKLLNEARKRGFAVRNVRRAGDRSLLLECAPRDYAALRALAEERGFEVGEMEPVGLPRLLRRLLARPGLLIAGALGTLLIVWALGYVWEIRVENAGPYIGEVRLYLEEQGVRPGIRRSQVDIAALREGLAWRLPKVKWVRAEWQGVVLRLRLEQGTPPPEESAAQAGDIVAREDGVIAWIAAYAGTPLAKPGDFVRAGQVLIQGQERRENGAVLPVRARGDVMARVWLTAKVRLPLAEYVTYATGRETEVRVIETPLFSWADRAEPEYLVSDRETRTLPLGGAWAPVWLRRETYREAYLEKTERDLETVKREGARAALEKLNLLAIHDEIVDKWLNFSMIEGGSVAVEATAEVARQIGVPARAAETP